MSKKDPQEAVKDDESGETVSLLHGKQRRILLAVPKRWNILKYYETFKCWKPGATVRVSKWIKIYSINFGQLRGMLLDLWHCWIYRWPRRLCWVMLDACTAAEANMSIPCPGHDLQLYAQVLLATNCWSSCSSLNMQLAIRDQELGGKIHMFVASDAIDSV